MVSAKTRVKRVAVAPGSAMLTRGWMMVKPRARSARHRIDLHAVQRMRDGFDHAPRGAGRQLRVGIERDHVANRQRQPSPTRMFLRDRRSPHRNSFRSSSLPRFRSRPIQLLLAFRPDARAVKQQETVRRG